MKHINIDRIDLSQLRGEIEQHENEWIAISENNTVAASGSTYADVLRKVEGEQNVVFFKVPPLDASLALLSK